MKEILALENSDEYKFEILPRILNEPRLTFISNMMIYRAGYCYTSFGDLEEYQYK